MHVYTVVYMYIYIQLAEVNIEASTIKDQLEQLKVAWTSTLD